MYDAETLDTLHRKQQCNASGFHRNTWDFPNETGMSERLSQYTVVGTSCKPHFVTRFYFIFSCYRRLVQISHGLGRFGSRQHFWSSVGVG